MIYIRSGDVYPTMLLNDTLKTIMYRRSVRAYATDPILAEEKDTIFQAAMRAPTAGNMMFYTIIEITKQETKDRLAKSCDNQPFIAKAPLVLLFLADLQRIYDLYECAAVPALCEAKGLSWRPPHESDLMLASCDALIAAQNAVIAAESLGIGSCYIGDILENAEIHRELFELPPWAFPITMVCFGHTKSDMAPEDRKLVARFPEKFIHHLDTYQRFTGEEFEDMVRPVMAGENTDLPIAESLTKRYGQALYERKTGSHYSREMIRSVKVLLKDWRGE